MNTHTDLNGNRGFRFSMFLVTIGIEPTVAQLDLTSDDARVTFQATKDIRDKYVLSRLAWDLGVMDELCALL